MIRVLAIDDHAVMRQGLTALFRSTPDIELVATAADATDAVDLSLRLAPDVILMDLALPGVDGVTATSEIRHVWADAVIVVLTTFADRELIGAALDAGAAGYLLKDADPSELLAGVRAAARREGVPLSPLVAREVLARRYGPAPVALTEREREIVVMVASGASNREIAAALTITPKTVKTHLTRIYAALGVTNRADAIAWARRNLPGG
jgi:DNA-binding NarL/FixJ family response regulator